VLRKTLPKLTGLLIVIFWLVMVGLLLKRELFVPSIPSAGHAAMYRDEWMGVYLPGEQPIGFIHVQETPEERNGSRGARIAIQAELELNVLEQSTDISLLGSARVGQETGLEQFEFSLLSGGHSLRLNGTVEEDGLKATVYTGGEEIPLQLPIDGDVMLSSGMGTMANLPVLEIGQEFVMDTFDPMTLTLGRSRIQCTGEEVIEVEGKDLATKVLTVTSSGVTSQVWVTEANEVVRAETPFGFTLKRVTSDEALRLKTGSQTTGFLSLAAIQPTGKRVFRGAKRMVVRLTSKGDFEPPPTDSTQRRRVDEGTYAITQPPTPTQTVQRGTAGPEFAAFLTGDTLIQSEHPDIVAKATEIVGDATDTWKAALRLYQWLYENIEKTPVVSVPSALEVLASGKGDCNEHTVLFTALARAAGIPTRIAIGVVWSDDLEGFYYHAWPEVYVNDWVWMEPTLGQPVADATHVKLISGDIAQWPRLITYLGNLDIEVREIE